MKLLTFFFTLSLLHIPLKCDNYYDILDIAHNATPEEIKEAYINKIQELQSVYVYDPKYKEIMNTIKRCMNKII